MTELSENSQLERVNEHGHVFAPLDLGNNLVVRLFQSMSPARLEGETYQEYKIRQKIIQSGIKHRKKYGIFA